MASVAPEEVAWAAGYYEGEGSMWIDKWCRRRKDGTRPPMKTPRVYPTIVSTDREPLERLQGLYGGSIQKPVLREGCRPLHRWTLYNTEAVKLFFTGIYPWLSPRRQAQINKAEMTVALKAWANGGVMPSLRDKEAC